MDRRLKRKKTGCSNQQYVNARAHAGMHGNRPGLRQRRRDTDARAHAHTGVHPRIKWGAGCCLGFIFLCLLGGAGASGEKPPDGRDHPLIARFPGSVIGHYAELYNEFILPLDAEVEEVLPVEGRVTQIQYRVEERSTVEVYRYYESLLTEAGFEVLFVHQGRTFTETRQWVADYYDVYAKQSWAGRNNPSFVGDDFRYLVAKLAGEEEDVFVSLYVTTKTRSIIQLDIIEGVSTLPELLRPDLAHDIDYREEVEKNGFVAVYDIFFASGEAEMLESSQQALVEIARLLEEDPGLTFYVVGHTDNMGTYEFNLDLSRRRAESVVRELVETYEIEEERLQPVGVGPVAPVDTNETREGRARNRRVELVVR